MIKVLNNLQKKKNSRESIKWFPLRVGFENSNQSGSYYASERQNCETQSQTGD